MKLRHILLAIIITISANAFSQTTISYDYKDKKVILPALIKELSKEDKYTFIMPSRLSYFSSLEEIQSDIWNPVTNIIEIKARVHNAKPDYKFELVTTGVQKITVRGIRFADIKGLDQNGIETTVKGFVRDYTCTFPCKLIIRNGQGQVLDEIVISNDTAMYSVALHRDFLKSNNSGISPKPTVPFASQEQITLIETTYGDAINKKIEQLIAYQVFNKASLAITHLFKNYNTFKQTYGFGFIKSSNGFSAFPEIDKIVTDYKAALDSLSVGNFEVCFTICEANKKIMEDLLASNDTRLDKNVKEVLFYNLSYACLLTNHFDEAWKYYDLVIQSGVSEQARLAYELRNRITLYQFYHGLRDQVTKAASATLP